MEGWLIYRREDLKTNQVFADRLVRAAATKGLQLRIVTHESVRFGVRANACFVESDEACGIPEYAIQRAVDPFLAHHLEAMHIRVFNRADISAMCNDKACTHMAVSALGVPMLPTVFADKGSLSAAANGLGWPLVVKAVGGRSGKQVFLAETVEDVRRLSESLPAGRYVVQPLCGTPGVDIRVFVVGGEVVAAIRRQSETRGSEGFRANFSMGGSATVHSLLPDELALVRKIASAFPFDYVGIDFLLDGEGGFLFNEIEDAVGSRTLSLCTEIDIADVFLTHVADQLRNASKKASPAQ